MLNLLPVELQLPPIRMRMSMSYKILWPQLLLNSWMDWAETVRKFSSRCRLVVHLKKVFNLPSQYAALWWPPPVHNTYSHISFCWQSWSINTQSVRPLPKSKYLETTTPPKRLDGSSWNLQEIFLRVSSCASDKNC